LPVRDGAELIIADTPEAFAAAVVRVLTDENLARALGQQAAATVRARFGWDKVAAEFAALCEQALAFHERGGVGAQAGHGARAHLPPDEFNEQVGKRA
jgi:hypothetical protein